MDFAKEQRRLFDPLITTVIETLDWKSHKNAWINCRDLKGNLYTIYPEYDENRKIQKNMFYVSKD